MKNIKVFILLLCLMLVGCGKKSYFTCNIDIDNNIDNYKHSGIYKIYYKGDYVTKIDKEDNYYSNNKNTLNYLNELNELQYYDLSDKYGGVTYVINSNEDSIEIKSSIDLKEFDIKSYSKDDKIDSNYVLSNKLLKNGIKRVYESRGAICK